VRPVGGCPVSVVTVGNVLVVADDAEGAALARGLRGQGMGVVTATDGLTGLRAGLQGGFEVIVLDVGLAGMSGYDILAQLRAAEVNTPVMLISSNGHESEQVTGLNLGADAYLVKPLSLVVLTAQVWALLRRQRISRGAARRYLWVGDLQLDPAARTASWKQCPVDLSPREYAVLHALVIHQGEVVSKTQLQRMAWGREVAVTGNAVEVYIGYLRRKLDYLGAGNLVHTVRGRGYQLALSP